MYDRKKLRVAVYLRVPSDDIDQRVSIMLQSKEYRKMILSNPDWEFAGAYVDGGFSGTNTDNAQAFKQLMKDSMDGKIDLIITKTVSRFAGNLTDCILWIEILGMHRPPVHVCFEQESLLMKVLMPDIIKEGRCNDLRKEVTGCRI